MPQRLALIVISRVWFLHCPFSVQLPTNEYTSEKYTISICANLHQTKLRRRSPRHNPCNLFHEQYFSGAGSVWLRAVCVRPNNSTPHIDGRKMPVPVQHSLPPMRRMYTCIIMDRSKTDAVPFLSSSFRVSVRSAASSRRLRCSGQRWPVNGHDSEMNMIFIRTFSGRLFRSPHGRLPLTSSSCSTSHRATQTPSDVDFVGRTAPRNALWPLLARSMATQPSGRTLYLNSTRVILMSLL